MNKHLKACKARKEAMDKAKGKKKEINLHHLVVTAAYSNYYWLRLEMNGDAVLEVLDRYLRAIWLECCGHLSDFLEPTGRGEELYMDERIEELALLVFSISSFDDRLFFLMMMDLGEQA